MNSDDYVVGWGTLTLINAGLAQAKGRSGLGWFLASLFLGPLATLLIVLLPATGPAYVPPHQRDGADGRSARDPAHDA